MVVVKYEAVKLSAEQLHIPLIFHLIKTFPQLYDAKWKYLQLKTSPVVTGLSCWERLSKDGLWISFRIKYEKFHCIQTEFDQVSMVSTKYFVREFLFFNLLCWFTHFIG